MDRKLLLDAADRGARYLEGIPERRAFPASADIERLERALDVPLPAGPSTPAGVLAFVDEHGSPATVASTGGRYYGFVTGGALPAAVASHMLATAWDQNGVNTVGSPASALFEQAALRWIREIFDFPAGSEGTFVTGATMANFTGLAAARHDVLHRAGWDCARRGLQGAPEVQLVVSAEAHGTTLKVLSMLGFGRAQAVVVPVDPQGRMRADALPAIQPPSIVLIQAGNVNSGSFDPAPEIVARAHAAGAWVHVDGAFGLWAHASPKRRQLMSGFLDADSWATDAHKWLNVPYDCGIAFVRHAAALRSAMYVSGEYLMLGANRDAIDLGPDSSRRARGLDVWAALKQLGRSGVAKLVDGHCDQAAWLAAELARNGVEVLNEVVLNQVVVAFGDDAKTRRTIAAIQEDGRIWCGGTRWRGREAMRISISSWATTQYDMEIALAAILAAAR